MVQKEITNNANAIYMVDPHDMDEEGAESAEGGSGKLNNFCMDYNKYIVSQSIFAYSFCHKSNNE